MNLVDLSHAVVSGQQTYPGLPAPVVDDLISHQDSRSNYTNGTEFQIGKLLMSTNTGTYVDSPYHRYRDRPDIAALDLRQLANLEAVCVRTAGAVLDRAGLEGIDVAGKAVLVHTGWAEKWGSSAYFHGHPFLTRGAAQRLASGGAIHVGIDSLNIDDTADGSRPVHTILLAADIPITEHLTNLDRVPDRGFRYFAVPVKVAGAGSFPVRAFALIP